MRILFLHRNFPGQFLHLAPHFARDPENQVVFVTARKDRDIPGVLKVVYRVPERDRSKTHHYLRSSEEAILHGQAAANAAIDLKRKGFVPDVIIGHTWGQNLFMKDVFPGTPLLGYFEWFYRAHGSDVDFYPGIPMTTDTEARVRVKNSPILIDLDACDQGICPTRWQLEQFPREFRTKIEVVHDGIDTDFFKPDPRRRLASHSDEFQRCQPQVDFTHDLRHGPVSPEIGPDMPGGTDIVTYVSRGLEPYRGFPQFMEAAALILRDRPRSRIVVVGEDKVFYGSALPGGKSYKDLALEKFTGDLSRVHFTGYLPSDRYREILRASAAHVYLTCPFVLSWSMLEAMSTGCLLFASNTPPVTEVVSDGGNGFLFDFFSPRELADKVLFALEHPEDMQCIRENARKTVLERYALRDLLPRQAALVEGLARRRARK